MKRNFAFILPLCLIPCFAQTPPPLMGVGDSLGEGVQSANAFQGSQPYTYLAWIGRQMNISFPQPLLSTGLFAFVDTVGGRSRISLSTAPADLAVSGATIGDVLNTVASTTPATETDLVLAPYYGMSQLQIVEQQKPALVVAWVGTDDLIDEILSFSSLNNPSPTLLPQFTMQYNEFASRLKATGSKVVLGNIPDFTKMAFLFDNNDLTRYTGTNYNLPAGTMTTLPTMLLLKLGALDASVLQNPAYVLTASRIAEIQAQIQQYNAVIASAAAANGFPLMDAYSLVEYYVTNPINIDGYSLSNHYNGGLFSLDGVHPSNTGHAAFANAFIQTANAAYGLNIPAMAPSTTLWIFHNDPFVDFGRQGVVHGRPFTGLLETLGPFLGISGGPTFHSATSNFVAARQHTLDKAEFMRRYYAAKGLSAAQPWNNADVVRAVEDIFGLKKAR